MAASKFIRRSSLLKSGFPNGNWTIPVLSALYSTFPCLNSAIAWNQGCPMDRYKIWMQCRYRKTIIDTWGKLVDTVPSFGFGMSPRGPRSFPRLATWNAERRLKYEINYIVLLLVILGAFTINRQDQKASMIRKWTDTARRQAWLTKSRKYIYDQKANW